MPNSTYDPAVMDSIALTAPYRHGGWYTSVRYPNGASGCVAKGIGGGWAVACVPDLGEYPTALDAARAEAAYVIGLRAATTGTA